MLDSPQHVIHSYLSLSLFTAFPPVLAHTAEFTCPEEGVRSVGVAPIRSEQHQLGLGRSGDPRPLSSCWRESDREYHAPSPQVSEPPLLAGSLSRPGLPHTAVRCKEDSQTPIPQTWESHCPPFPVTAPLSQPRPKTSASSLTRLLLAHSAANLLAIPAGTAFKVHGNLAAVPPSPAALPDDCNPPPVAPRAASAQQLEPVRLQVREPPSSCRSLRSLPTHPGPLVMSSLPAAAVASSHNVRGWNNTSLRSCGPGGLESQNGLVGWPQGVGSVPFLLEALGEDLSLCPFQPCREAACPLWLVAPLLWSLLPCPSSSDTPVSLFHWPGLLRLHGGPLDNPGYSQDP